MKYVLPFVIAGFMVGSLAAADGEDDASESVFWDGDIESLSQFVWEKRPLIVFADSPNDSSFGLQMEYLNEGVEGLAERDVVVLTDTDPSSQSALRTKLRPRGFMMVLIGKDGVVKLRKPLPWDVRELSRTIDKMPVRQREVRERRAAGDG